MNWTILVIFMSGNIVSINLLPPHDEVSCRQLAKELNQTKPNEVKSVACIYKGPPT